MRLAPGVVTCGLGFPQTPQSSGWNRHPTPDTCPLALLVPISPQIRLEPCKTRPFLTKRPF